MADIRKIVEGVTRVEFPEPQVTFLIDFLYIDGHHSQQFVSSSIKSIACCNSGEAEKFDHDIDQIHCHSFRQGHWIKARREHFPPLTNDNSIPSVCQNKQFEAFMKLHSTKVFLEDECSQREVREDYDQQHVDRLHSRLKRSLFMLPGEFTLNRKSSIPVKRARRNGDWKEIKEVAEGIEKSLNELCGIATIEQRKEVQLTIAQVSGAASTACFVQRVVHGIELLLKPVKAPSTIRFGRLVDYCRKRIHDDGAQPNDLLTSTKTGVNDRSKDLKFDSDLLTGNIQVFRESVLDAGEMLTNLRSELPQNLPKLLASLAPTSSKAATTKDRNANRNMTAKKHKIVNQIIDRLYQTVGPSSLIIYSALKVTKSKFSELSDVRNEDIEYLVSSAVDALSSMLQNISDDVTVLFIPAVVAYLLGVGYPLACHALHLWQFAADDLGIVSRLDELAQELNSLDHGAHEYRFWRLNIEDRAANVMSVPISKLRSISTAAITEDGPSKLTSSLSGGSVIVMD
ncbi:hypothetical protein Landi51_13902 [Colletotrichum acutatum]